MEEMAVFLTEEFIPIPKIQKVFLSLKLAFLSSSFYYFFYNSIVLNLINDNNDFQINDINGALQRNFK